MKKITIIALVVLALTSLSVIAFAAGGITVEAAKQIALERAGVTIDQATFNRVHLDHDDGRTVYEVELIAGGVEYDIDIDARTGAIVEFDIDRD